VIALSAQSVRSWNTRFRGYFEEIAAVHPPRAAVDLDALADMLSCVVDGGIIMGKMLREPRRLEQQIMTFRSFVGLVFAPPPSTVAVPPAMSLAAE
jgi:TetR/AcrR family transcriptional repressor of nem operon